MIAYAQTGVALSVFSEGQGLGVRIVMAHVHDMSFVCPVRLYVLCVSCTLICPLCVLYVDMSFLCPVRSYVLCVSCTLICPLVYPVR